MKSIGKRDEAPDLIAGLDGYWEAASRKNVEEFLAAASSEEWLSHVNGLDLDAELHLAERSQLDPALFDREFDYPLSNLEGTELGREYRKLLEGRGEWRRLIAVRFVHLRSRQIMRRRLGLPELEPDAIWQFFSSSVPRAQPYNARVLEGEGREPRDRDIDIAASLMVRLYPTVVDYFRAVAKHLATEEYQRGRYCRIGNAHVPWHILRSVAATHIDSSIGRADRHLIARLTGSSLLR
jgi:hypothetical protein